MTETLQRFRNHCLRWREWELNPIVIKELRQAVRNWSVTGMLILFLVILFITTLGFLLGNSFNNSGSSRLGADIFHVFAGILTGASLLFIPLYVGIRLAAERQESNHDLLYISTLSPGRIIRGKFFCGAYIALLFFSACLPFMAFTNLLRGIDLPSIFVVLVLLYLSVCSVNMAAIFVACLPTNRAFKILLALGGLSACCGLIAPLMYLTYELLRSGVGAMVSGSHFWIGFILSVGVTLALTGLLYFLSVAMISPPSSNRALPVRAYITFVWLVSGLLTLSRALQTGDAQPLLPWMVIMQCLLTATLLNVISNQDELSPRVRREIPRTRGKRLLALFFYNGAAGGLAWIVSLLALTAGLTFVMVGAFPVSNVDDFVIDSSVTLLYTLDYALLALWLHRRFLPGRPAKLTGIMAVLFAGLWALLPNIFLFFVNRLSWQTVERLQLGNICNIFVLKTDDKKMLHLVFAAGWLVVMILLNVRWFIAQLKKFQYLERTTIPTVAVPPPMPVRSYAAPPMPAQTPPAPVAIPPMPPAPSAPSTATPPPLPPE